MDTDLKSSTVPAEKKIEIVREALLKEVEFLYKNSLLNHKFIKEDIFNKEVGIYCKEYNEDIINSFKGMVEESKKAVSGEDDGRIQLRKIEDLDRTTIYSIDEETGGYITNDKDVKENLEFRAIKTKKQKINLEQSIKVLDKKYIEQKIKEDISYHATKGEIAELKKELESHKESASNINLVVNLLTNMMKDPTDKTPIGLNGDTINKALLYLTKLKNGSSKKNYQNEFNKIAGAPRDWETGGYVKVKDLRKLEDVAGSETTSYSNKNNIKKVFEPWKDKADPNHLENELYCLDQSFVYLPSKEGGKIPNAYYQMAYNNKIKNALLDELDASKKEVK